MMMRWTKLCQQEKVVTYLRSSYELQDKYCSTKLKLLQIFKDAVNVHFAFHTAVILERSQFRLRLLQYSITLICSKYLKTNKSLLWEERKSRVHHWGKKSLNSCRVSLASCRISVDLDVWSADLCRCFFEMFLCDSALASKGHIWA